MKVTSAIVIFVLGASQPEAGETSEFESAVCTPPVDRNVDVDIATFDKKLYQVDDIAHTPPSKEILEIISKSTNLISGKGFGVDILDNAPVRVLVVKDTNLVQNGYAVQDVKYAHVGIEGMSTIANNCQVADIYSLKQGGGRYYASKMSCGVSGEWKNVYVTLHYDVTKLVGGCITLGDLPRIQIKSN